MSKILEKSGESQGIPSETKCRNHIITDCVCSMREGYVLTHVCLSVSPRGVPSQVRTWGYPCWGDTPPLVTPIGPGWGYPTSCSPPRRTWPGGPHPRYPPPPPPGPGWGGGHPTSGGLIRRGRYASCVHAGGLSCCLTNMTMCTCA